MINHLAYGTWYVILGYLGAEKHCMTMNALEMLLY